MATTLAVALLLTACGSQPANTGATKTSTASPNGPDLGGRTFSSTGVTKAGKPLRLADGTRVSLSFGDGQVTAHGGCNILSGDATYDTGVLLMPAPVSMTEMGCDEQRMAQDDWLASILTSKPLLSLDGDQLTVTSGATVLTLLDTSAVEPDQPLTGTRWVLESIVSGGSTADAPVSSVPAGTTSTLLFTNRRVQIQAGCNSGGAAVSFGASTITVGPVVMTEMACGGRRDAVEAAVLAVLVGRVDYVLHGSRLTLTNGGRGVTYRAGRAPA